jgi:hypothetical protein
MVISICIQVIYQICVIGLLVFSGPCWIPEKLSVKYSQLNGNDDSFQWNQSCGNGKTIASAYHVSLFNINTSSVHGFKQVIKKIMSFEHHQMCCNCFS